MRLQGMLRRLVILTRDWPMLAAVYRAVYAAAPRATALLFSRILGRSLALHLRRGMAAGRCAAGVSDVDLLAVLDIPADREERTLRRLWRLYRGLKRVFPMLGELQVSTPGELSAYLTWGGTRRLEAPSWLPLTRAEPPRPRPSPDEPRLRLHEALHAYLFLSQTYFEASRPPRLPDFGFRVAKGFLDVLRYSEPGTGLPADRRQTLAEISARLPRELGLALEQPLSLGREAALSLLGLALERLDSACRGLGEGPSGPRPAGAGHAPPPNAYSDEWPGRLAALGPGAGFFMDTLFRWFAVLPEVPDAEALTRAAGQLDGWHLGESRFRNTGWLSTPAVLQGLMLTPHLDTPFFGLVLGGADRGDGLWVRTASRQPLWDGQYRLRWGIPLERLRFPTEGELRRCSRQACAELALSLRLYGREEWAGGNSYRLFFLYSRVLSLSLYLRTGRLADPHDIDALVEAHAEAFPESISWLRGAARRDFQRPAAELDALPRADLFYRHLPFLGATFSETLKTL